MTAFDAVPWLLALVASVLFVWAAIRQHTERDLRVKAELDRDRYLREATDALEREARAARHTWGWFAAYRHEVATRRRFRGCPKSREYERETDQ